MCVLHGVCVCCWQDPLAPKKPSGAYMWYCQAKRPALKQQHPGMSITELGSLLGQMWNQETKAGKKEYFAQVTGDGMAECDGLCLVGKYERGRLMGQV